MSFCHSNARLSVYFLATYAEKEGGGGSVGYALSQWHLFPYYGPFAVVGFTLMF